MKTILVIDDRDDLRMMIADTLAVAGYAVREARNGRDGILMVLAQRPDLILCDINMPEVDGYRTLEAIRKCDGTAGIPFIMMTGSVIQNNFRRAMNSGADDYMPRPFTPAELITMVEARLARQSRTDSPAAKEAMQAAEAETQVYLQEAAGRLDHVVQHSRSRRLA
jgi:CRP/FNR family cyclic AMP-dependent transcriptional regulator